MVNAAEDFSDNCRRSWLQGTCDVNAEINHMSIDTYVVEWGGVAYRRCMTLGCGTVSDGGRKRVVHHTHGQYRF